ncbi:helix-turn-helix domain-containing protein [Paenibacillus sepulcri]|uniref:AraC family transcriptional regulator n=1 Tax=Paenibacillus sepulcri TaxID=359917 RepID=A0ABS7CCK1_9BACL|nr:AraC family transcriptional regulator [Paenibacillus sepulcri]
MEVDLNELAGQIAGGQLSVDGVYRVFLPSGSYPAHTREYPTPFSGFVFALRGRGTFIFEGREAYELIPGKIVHGAKNMELSLVIDEPGLEYCLIHYTLAREAVAERQRYADTHYSLETGENAIIAQLLQLLHEVYGVPGHMSAVRIKELFYSLLYESLTAARNQQNRESEELIRHAIEHIHNRYREPITLASLAQLEGLEVKQFSYLFNKYSGMFPIDYLIQHRMKRARQLLAQSNCSISGIAESIGYNDPHYFSRLFKKHTGSSPRAFRSGLGNNPHLLE